MLRSKTFLRLSINPNTDTDYSDDVEFPQNKTPLPTNFAEFLPWACLRMQFEFELAISKKIQSDPSLIMDKSAKGKPRPNISLTDNSPLYRKSDDRSNIFSQEGHIVNLTATYDSNYSLVHLKFDRNSKKPQQLLKLIKVIVHFYENLTKITVEPPVQKYIPYELSKILEDSNITEVCFDGCFLPECNYYVLLEGGCRLKSISLARCNITDEVLKIMCSNLCYPCSASKSLRILNLASNKITDFGAKHIANALRTNRQLAYLNLSDNLITDRGASEIFDILTEFRLNDKELADFHQRHLVYLKARMELMDRIYDELKSDFIERKTKKKPKHNAEPKVKPRPKEYIKSYSSTTMSMPSDVVLMEKAQTKLEESIGDFVDPFSDLFQKNDFSYSLGNNSLQILNLAFNQITYLSLRKLKDVLMYQKVLDRMPIGLIHVVLNGNRLPIKCKESRQLEELFDSAISTGTRKVPMDPKKKAKSAK